jgi:hypothetical protein
VHERRTSKAVMGWAALALIPLPGWSMRAGADQRGYQEGFRLAILARKAELMGMAGK